MAYALGNVQPQTRSAVAILGPRFHIGTVYGYSNRNIAGTNVKSDHAYGLAADFMCSIPTGNALAEYAKAHARALDVKYIIHNRRIWSVARASEGWRPYSGASPHTDHVHISFNGNGKVTDPGGTVPDVSTGKSDSNGGGAVHATGAAFTASPAGLVGGIGDVYTFLTTPLNWLRLAMFAGGLLILILGITAIARTTTGV